MSNTLEIVDKIIEGSETSLQEADALIHAELQNRADDLMNSGRDYILGSLGMALNEAALSSTLKTVKAELEDMLSDTRYRVEDGIMGDFFRFTVGDLTFSYNSRGEFNAYHEKTHKDYFVDKRITGRAAADEIYKLIKKYI